MTNVKEGHGNHVFERGFKSKTMVYTIERKIHDWLKSITDKDLVKEVENHCILTGGAITSMLLGELPNDYDIYFDSAEMAHKVANYYCNNTKIVEGHDIGDIQPVMENGQVRVYIKMSGCPRKLVRYVEPEHLKQKIDTKYKPISINTNAITLTDDVQIILRFAGKPEEIHRSFDFVHPTNYYTKASGIVFNPKALEHTLSKELKYIGSLYPICSVFRIKKFIERGWTITAGEILKIAYDISKLNLDNPEVLEDQLIGVDVAYFNEILNALKIENKPIERTYLFELVNRVFDTADLVDLDLEEGEEKTR